MILLLFRDHCGLATLRDYIKLERLAELQEDKMVEYR